MERVIPERRVATYTVRNGDTISSIARQQTGFADYSAIYEQNKSLIGGNPNNILPGMVLTIPTSNSAESDSDW